MLLGACAPPRRQTSSVPQAAWYGRLAMKVDSLPPQSFHASFELLGQPEAGTLRLFTPLGGTAAELRWQPGLAVLQSAGEIRNYASMDELTLALTGAALPLAALFHWLQGEQVTLAGWQVDLTQLDQGRLHAQRLEPTPTVDLRVLLER
ncbi:outer membrane lipoprotein LolB [Curvibacter sp. RS43]|jgi:outer membrane lipoprotein LolB|uniref:Outer-membrane lipoprotein LolB n=1 Tax=Curvibacter microcysteis TaxID=3026419 RepID=A0ABT5MIH9_9BURK|nr:MULTISPECIES: outer membrane lipoprotein LolB [unclassified Curvibacter]MDD0810439.1 outer membrane lipoprotein LolB [Curvibacter sp. RS43]MDD0816393.1 outer membrane lipoprotein LolB [Curvibacter sp. HBC28]